MVCGLQTAGLQLSPKPSQSAGSPWQNPWPHVPVPPHSDAWEQVLPSPSVLSWFTQDPSELHVSTSVQPLPSSHEAPCRGGWLQKPSPSQTSFVHSLKSLPHGVLRAS